MPTKMSMKGSGKMTYLMEKASILIGTLNFL